MINRIIGGILGICLIVGLPLAVRKHIDYLYSGSQKKLTELQRSEQEIKFLIMLTLVTIAILGVISVLVK